MSAVWASTGLPIGTDPVNNVHGALLASRVPTLPIQPQPRQATAIPDHAHVSAHRWPDSHRPQIEIRSARLGVISRSGRVEMKGRGGLVN
jgi:hypothetical protein